MTRCPNCGSSAQVRVIETEYNEYGWDIEVVRTYKCGCGQRFIRTSFYTYKEGYEIIAKIKNKG